MEEEEIFASPNTVCTGCPVLEKKIVFYQKRSVGKEDQRVN